MNYVKFDMHCHTVEGSCDSFVSLHEFASILIKKGFGGMLVTDHNSYKAFDSLDRSLYPNFVILKGIEYDTRDFGHMIVVLPDNADTKPLEFRGLCLEKLIDFVHEKGGIIGPSHPAGETFLSFYSTGIRHGHYYKMTEFCPLFDFFEGFNACEDKKANRIGRALANRYNKVVTGGSDAHWKDCVGAGYAYLPESIRTNDDLIRFIKSKEKIRLGGHRFYGTIKDRLGKWNHFLVAGFYFYNKFESMLYFVKRHFEQREE